jgi:FkbM family methyltransferase
MFARLVVDHTRRTIIALAGFKALGLSWARPWFSYLLSPILNRFSPARVVRFVGFNVRCGQCDLYTFANLFEDYPIEIVRQALREVDLVLDLGANVGAFSFLVRVLCEQDNLWPSIKSLEPNPQNVAFLRQQPFAHGVEIAEAAVGPTEGWGQLVAGKNSVTDRVDFSDTRNQRNVRVVTLETLCDRPALVKMDIEGGEREILRNGLPPNVLHLLLEWHASAGTERDLAPSDFVAGNWMKLSSDPYGSSMWYFRR